jgi:phosphate transport system permease protein
MKMFKQEKPVGEIFVWLTSLGLAVGLTMVGFLLVLVFSNGVQVFWPHLIVQIYLKSPASDLNGAISLGGRIVKEQEKVNKVASAAGAPQSNNEYQLFLGNKDVYGFGFKYIDVRAIDHMAYPENVIELERQEYGDAIGIPESVELAAHGTIKSSNPGFSYWLNKSVEETNDRWDEIRVVEKRQIGSINHEMERLQIRQRAILRRNPKSTAPELKEIEKNIQTLQTRYEQLASKAAELRKKQQGDFFNYNLISGEKKRIAISQIVHYYFPNNLTFAGRFTLFLQKFWRFLSEEPREANTEGGIFPAIFGTFVMTLLLSLAVTPFGVLAAIYLREYAIQGIFVRSVRIAVNNLAGVPSIVFGVFGLGFFVYLLGGTIDRLFFSDYLPTPTFGTGGILWASLTLALMTVPVVIVATEEALAAVPRGTREGSLACGASKWQTIQRVVLPASSQGILTGLILAMARGAGEVAPLMLVGVVKLAPSLPLDTTYPFLHLDQKFMHLGFHIYDLGFQSPDSEAAKPMVFATTFLLIMLVVLLNLGAIIIREKLRKRYAMGAF